MRIILWLFFSVVTLLIFIENGIKKIGKLFSRKKHRRKKKQSVFSLPFRTKIKYFFFGILFSCIFVVPPLISIVFLQDLPTPQGLAFRQVPQTTKIFDRKGTLLAEIYTQQNRTLVTLDDIPLDLQHATLAIEDKNFYSHPGFDIPSIIRAFRETVINHNIQGGSTITQQLIKSSILTPEQTISRKIKEIALAFWTERLYTKKQILEMYFNQVPYGGTAWGIEAAAEKYFNKPVSEVTLAESAFLAGLTKAPTYYSPYGSNPDAWKKRQKEVLNRMVALRYITPKRRNQALSETLHFREPTVARHAPHFVEYMKELLIKKYGIAAVEKGGLQVTTSLDLETQEMAEQIVKEEVEKAKPLNLTNGASLITNPQNGDILAMVGSHDFNDPNGGNFNVVTSHRQPGSSIKVVTYTAALMHGFTAASSIDDTPVSYPMSNGQRYTPVNYDRRFHGRVSLRFALANSLNIPAVKTLNAIGIPTMVDLGKRMGITSFKDPIDYGLSLTLGAAEVTMLDMARVNGVLANQGKLVPLDPILRVTDGKGSVLEEKKHIEPAQIIDPGITFIMSNILADNPSRAVEFGSNSPLFIPDHTVSVKTGTTNNKRDNWTNGYTNNYVVIVWVGNNDNSPMSQELASGITGAAPIWHRIMVTLLTKHPETPPTKPENVVKKMCFGKPEYFIQRTENTVLCGTITSSPTQLKALPMRKNNRNN